MLQNAYLFAKIGADTAENEQHLPKICEKLTTTLRVPSRTAEPAYRIEKIERLTREKAALEDAVTILRSQVQSPVILHRGPVFSLIFMEKVKKKASPNCKAE